MQKEGLEMLDLRGKNIKFLTSEKTHFNSLYLGDGKAWDRMGAAIKKRLKTHLETVQNKKCAYCGVRVEVAGRGEIEHIVPKGKSLYPQFTFHELNLVLICELCNGSSRKGSKDIISRNSPIYSLNKFKIVHPFFDNPETHYDWVNNAKINIIEKSSKGRYSIDLFQLDSIQMTEYRAKDKVIEIFLKTYDATDPLQVELFNALIALPR